MKKLPEKIYVTPNFDRRWQTKAIDDESVEYVRKDAFVKKVVEHIDGLIELLNEFGHRLKKARIIEDFKKHVED